MSIKFLQTTALLRAPAAFHTANSERLFSGRDLRQLVIPLVLELFLTLLVGMIDSVMVAGVGEAAVSAISLVDTVMQLIIYLCAALGTGGAIVAGQYLGSGDRKQACAAAAFRRSFFSGSNSRFTSQQSPAAGLFLCPNHAAGQRLCRHLFNHHRLVCASHRRL